MCLAGLSFVVVVTNCLTSVCHIGLVVINVHFYTIAVCLYVISSGVCKEEATRC